MNAGLSMTGVSGLHRNGDVVPITVRATNSPTNSCDVTDATVTLQFPNPDGTYNGTIVTLAQHLDFPVGSDRTFPAVNFTPSFTSGAFRGTVTAELDGVKHWATTDSTNGLVIGIGNPFDVTHPHATAGVTPTPASGPTPLSVTYDYTVQNDSSHDSDGFTPEPEIDNVAMSDDTCASPAYTGGDNNPADSLLTVGETWTFSCMTQLFGGVYTNHASLSGTSTADARPWPATTAQSVVNVDGADMRLAKSHVGTFTQGDTGRAYTLTATNSGTQPSTGEVTVSDALPTGLTPTLLVGSGWNCTLGTLSCTRSDALGAGESYPAITLIVDVAKDAPSVVTNTATLTRANENNKNNAASDPTTIAEPAPVDQPSQGNDQPPQGNDQPVVDRTPPTFVALLMPNTAFAVDRAGRSETLVAATARKKGTAFRYTLSEPARVVFRIDRKMTGRRVGKACRKPTRRNRHARTCTRYVSQGAFAQNSIVGPNVRKWSGKLGAKSLTRGRYRATVVATDAAGKVAVGRQLNFRIV
jgi:uncharacterized repeat protein (TIGR01451 family)